MSVIAVGGKAAAQTSQSGNSQAQTPPIPGRLTVRPKEVATGMRNEKSGEQSLDSLPNYKVYVSQQCVGRRRCPLVVLLGGGGYGSKVVMEYHAQHAEKYGMILLAPDPVKPGLFDLIEAFENNELKAVGESPVLVREFLQAPDFKNIDAAMKQVLRKYAINPDQIAVAGMSDGGSYSLFLGLNNLDIFSRIAPLSPGIYFGGIGPRNNTTQFFLAGGLAEGASGFFQNPLKVARDQRREGHYVKQVLSLRPHENRLADHEHMWRWLKESWERPDPAVRSVPAAGVNSLPVLTIDGVKRFIAFWTSFMKQPDSVSRIARMAHVKEFPVPVGEDLLWTLMSDIPALSAKYPSIAADLKTAGLTPQHAQAYRIALISAVATHQADGTAGQITQTSVLGQNVLFIYAHPAEIQALTETGMWTKR